MSDTPETEANVGYFDVANGRFYRSVVGGIVEADFARQLERRLLVALIRIKELEENSWKLVKLATEKIERIKDLEEKVKALERKLQSAENEIEDMKPHLGSGKMTGWSL